MAGSVAEGPPIYLGGQARASDSKQNDMAEVFGFVVHIAFPCVADDGRTAVTHCRSRPPDYLFLARLSAQEQDSLQPILWVVTCRKLPLATPHSLMHNRTIPR